VLLGAAVTHRIYKHQPIRRVGLVGWAVPTLQLNVRDDAILHLEGIRQVACQMLSATHRDREHP
jgi:hypothetical protein